jgi:N-acetylglutamate synthase-like GNAT family acetyltransferase
VREATEADLPRLVALLDQLSPDERRERPGPPLPAAYTTVFRQIAADPNQQLLVLERDGELAGSAAVIIVPNLTHQGTPYAIVENVVVDGQQRGGGGGEALMRRVLELAREAGCYKVALTSNKRRDAAHRFYRRLGFEASHEGFRIDL